MQDKTFTSISKLSLYSYYPRYRMVPEDHNSLCIKFIIYDHAYNRHKHNLLSLFSQLCREYKKGISYHKMKASSPVFIKIIQAHTIFPATVKFDKTKNKRLRQACLN